MKRPRRTTLRLTCTTTVAACLVASASFPISGRAQVGAPAGRPAPAGTLAPLLGGNLPAPTHDLTITWDARFQPVPRKAAISGQYYVIEGDIVIGTQDAVVKAQRNELVTRAKRLRAAANLDNMQLPKAALDELNKFAELPQEETTITPGAAATSSVSKSDVARFLLDSHTHTAAQRPAAAGGPSEQLKAFACW